MLGLLKLLKIPQKIMQGVLSVLDNKYVLNLLKLFLVIYAGAIAPKLPGNVLKAFDHQLVKLAVFALIIYTGTKDPTLSLLVAIAFNITLVTLAKVETAQNIGEILTALVDGPQQIVNDVLDGTQDLIGSGLNTIESTLESVVPVGQATKMAGSAIDAVIDGVQDVGNAIIDGAQGLVGTAVDKAMDLIPGMGVEDFAGFDGGDYGAAF